MRIFDEELINEINYSDVDFSIFKLVQTKRLVKHHEAVKEIKEKFHYEVIKEYANGGKDVKKVVDVASVEPKDAYDEFEDVLQIAYLTDDEKNNIRKSGIQERLNSISQDIIQSMTGELVPEIEQRKKEFIELHNELRILLNKEPREIIKLGE